jgi:hypothetical protein
MMTRINQNVTKAVDHLDMTIEDLRLTVIIDQTKNGHKIAEVVTMIATWKIEEDTVKTSGEAMVAKSAEEIMGTSLDVLSIETKMKEVTGIFKIRKAATTTTTIEKVALEITLIDEVASKTEGVTVISTTNIISTGGEAEEITTANQIVIETTMMQGWMSSAHILVTIDAIALAITTIFLVLGIVDVIATCTETLALMSQEEMEIGSTKIIPKGIPTRHQDGLGGIMIRVDQMIITKNHALVTREIFLVLVVSEEKTEAKALGSGPWTSIISSNQQLVATTLNLHSPRGAPVLEIIMAGYKGSCHLSSFSVGK